MKKLFFLVILFVFGCSSENQNFNLLIEGNLYNVPENEQVKLIFREPDQAKVLDSAQLKNGKFSFKIFLDKSGFLVLQFSSNKYPIFLYVEPPDTITLMGDFRNLKATYKVFGNQQSKWIQILENRLAITDSLYFVFLEKQDTAKIDSLFLVQKNFNKNFIWQNPTSIISIIALSEKLPNGQPIFNPETDFRIFWYVDSLLRKKYPLDKNVLALHKFIVNHKIKQIRDAKPIEKIQIRKQAINFNLKTLDGKILTVSQLKGKKVLIYFWATWCSSCNNSFDFLSQIRKKFPNIVIIQYSLDFDKEKLMQYLSNSNYDWYQVCDCKGWESRFIQNYNVEKIPSGVIIDENGIIKGYNLTDKEIMKILANE